MPPAASDPTCVQKCPLQYRRNTEGLQAGVQRRVAPAARLASFGHGASERQQHGC
jgi:hypothetical protein